MERRVLLLAAAATSLSTLTGCGGDGAPPAAATAPRPGGHQPSAESLQRDVGNGFREGLARLAVMQQRGDDATDLGQSLPTGLLSGVRCAAGGGPAPAAGARWRCAVSWQTASGAPRRTRYDVRVWPGGCFGAAASPSRPARYDPTTRAFSEDPLDAIVSADPACS